jgi:hypothetical protein
MSRHKADAPRHEPEGGTHRSLLIALPRHAFRRICGKLHPSCLVPGLAVDGVEREGAKAMLKTSVLAAFLAIVALSPAYAAQDLCNEAHMKQMDDMIAKMTDATKKKEATTALDMSKAAMKKGDTAGCMKHMDEAHKAMGM